MTTRNDYRSCLPNNQPSTISSTNSQASPMCGARKMFGEYALYCNGRVVALVCDNELFVKITDAGKEFVGDQYREGTAYPGAKPSMRIDMDMAENREWLWRVDHYHRRKLYLCQ